MAHVHQRARFILQFRLLDSRMLSSIIDSPPPNLGSFLAWVHRYCLTLFVALLAFRGLARLARGMETEVDLTAMLTTKRRATSGPCLCSLVRRTNTLATLVHVT